MIKKNKIQKSQEINFWAPGSRKQALVFVRFLDFKYQDMGWLKLQFFYLLFILKKHFLNNKIQQILNLNLLIFKKKNWDISLSFNVNFF